MAMPGPHARNAVHERYRLFSSGRHPGAARPVNTSRLRSTDFRFHWNLSCLPRVPAPIPEVYLDAFEKNGPNCRPMVPGVHSWTVLPSVCSFQDGGARRRSGYGGAHTRSRNALPLGHACRSTRSRYLRWAKPCPLSAFCGCRPSPGATAGSSCVGLVRLGPHYPCLQRGCAACLPWGRFLHWL